MPIHGIRGGEVFHGPLGSGSAIRSEDLRPPLLSIASWLTQSHLSDGPWGLVS